MPPHSTSAVTPLYVVFLPDFFSASISISSIDFLLKLKFVLIIGF